MVSWFADSAEEFRKQVTRAAASAQKLAERADEGFQDLSDSLRDSANNLAEQGEAARQVMASKVAAVAETAAAATVPLLCNQVQGIVQEPRLEELVHRFETEAQALAALLQTPGPIEDSQRPECAGVAEAASARAAEVTLRGWVDSLSAEAVEECAHPELAGSAGLSSPTLQALLRSGALATVLQALATSSTCRRSLRRAALECRDVQDTSTAGKLMSSSSDEGSGWTLVQSAESMQQSQCPEEAVLEVEKGADLLTEDALASCLLVLLQKVSPTPPGARLADLLDLLASAGETLERSLAIAYEGDLAGPEDDMQWILSILMSSLVHSTEAEALATADLCQAVEQTLARRSNIAITSVSPSSCSRQSSGDGSRSPSAQAASGHANDVWACWPPEGVWYRAKVRGNTSRTKLPHGLIQVAWLRVPAHLVGSPVEEEYLHAQGRDDVLFTELGPSAVISMDAAGGRPAPVHIDRLDEGDEQEDAWVEELNLVEEHGQAFTSLHVLCRRLDALLRDSVSEAPPAEAHTAEKLDANQSPPPLVGVEESLRHVRATQTERLEALGMQSKESAEEAVRLQEEVQKCSDTMGIELQAMKSERSLLLQRAESLQKKRQELLQALQQVDEELGDASASLADLDGKESRLRDSMDRVSEELALQVGRAEELSELAGSRKCLLERACEVSSGVESSVAARAAKVKEVCGAKLKLQQQQEVITQNCLESESGRCVRLEGLVSSWREQIWGPGAAILAQDSVKSATVRSMHIRARGIIDHILIEVEEMIAKTGGSSALEGLLSLDGALGLNGSFSAAALDRASLLGNKLTSAGSAATVGWQVARSLPRYKLLQQQLVENLDRLCELEAAVPAASCRTSPGEEEGI
mmetsp:Transcript_48756/g.115861  ORF Transcript_48756/g.115861 Transcript_48756/m.115861 type:complete len:872 (-) Transcript_48756:98-2713(-)